jgi:predicted  nucleic acid-binding Zn-ribbon protein
MHQVMHGQVALEDHFSQERQFFSEQVATNNRTIEELNSKIRELENDLDFERNSNLKMFVDQEV